VSVTDLWYPSCFLIMSEGMSGKLDMVINDKVWEFFGTLQVSAGANRNEQVKNGSKIWVCRVVS